MCYSTLSMNIMRPLHEFFFPLILMQKIVIYHHHVSLQTNFQNTNVPFLKH